MGAAIGVLACLGICALVVLCLVSLGSAFGSLLPVVAVVAIVVLAVVCLAALNRGEV